MPSKEKRGKEKEVKFKAAKKKYNITPSKIATYTILILLAVALIGIPALRKERSVSDGIVFGHWDKDPIEFKLGNYFYRQYQALARQGGADSSATGAYQMWSTAYQRSVYHHVLNEMADKAGIVIAKETLNEAIRESGAFHKDGAFDRQTYEEATIEFRNEVHKTYEENLKPQMVVEDLSTVLSSDAERDYVVAIGDEGRTFSYVLFSPDMYPDEAALSFAQSNPAWFTQIDLSIISMQEQEELELVAAQIASGELTFEAAAQEHSLDGYAHEGGRLGVLYLFELQHNFFEEDQVNELFSVKANTLSPVFATPTGYALYRVEAQPWMADFEDSDVLRDVKNYMSNEQSEIINEYLIAKAETFAQAAVADFAESANQEGLEVVSVGATPPNIWDSTYLLSFAYTDPMGALSMFAQSEDALKMIYNSEAGTILGPFVSNDSFLVLRVGETEALEESMSSYLSSMYTYIAQSNSQTDLVNSIFTSDRLDDNFLSVFIDEIMGY